MRRATGMLTADSLPRAGAMSTIGHAAAATVAGRPDELPAGLPVQPLLATLQGDVEEGQLLELARPDERPDVDRVEADRARRARAPSALASASSPATKPSSWTPSTIGSAWLRREQRC